MASSPKKGAAKREAGTITITPRGDAINRDEPHNVTYRKKL